PRGRGCSRRGGCPLAGVGGTGASSLPEAEAQAHRRFTRRPRYRPACDCGAHPGIVTAPPAPRVIPKSLLGVSIPVELLVDKYLSYRPTYRLLADLQMRDLDLSLGTVTDALQRLRPLFEPVYEALAAHSRRQPLWH